MTGHLWLLGDSWTDPVTYPWAPAQGWPQLLAAALEVGIVNSGRGGAGYVRQTTASIPSQAAMGAGAGAAAVLVWGSLNDANNGYSAADVAAGARTTYGLVRRLCPDAPLIVVGPQWGATEPPALLLAHRDVMADAAADAAATYVDPTRWFIGQTGLMLDANHVTSAGHVIVADRLAPEVAVAVGAYAART